MKSLRIIVIAVTAVMFIAGCRDKTKEKELDTFINKHVAKIKPLMKELNLASWSASNSGKEADYEKVSELQLRLRKIYSDANEFSYLKQARDSQKIKDRMLSRQLDRLYYAYLENQIDPELMKRIVKLGNKIEQNFSTFRGTIGGKKVSDNDIRDVLKENTNSAARQKAWEASKQVGPVVAGDLIVLVKLRNEAARKVGFDNYHTMSLALSEQDVKEVDKIFDELDRLTAEPFRKVKEELDGQLASNYGVEVKDLMPWHYHDPFFQESPLVYQINLDIYYEAKDVKELAAKFYAGIGLPVEAILDKSDLYEREGKNPHAFCSDMDREGDVRVLCNIKNNEQWMETMLHELGHSVYGKYNDSEVPYLLREPAHTFTTEAVAMLMGRQSRDAQWMKEMLNLPGEEKQRIEETCKKYAQLKQLIFARWVLVMYNFEKQLYANPEQDLNSLWWNMAEKYQLVRRPEGRNSPDWAAKIHFTIAPCYYHNYAMGELLASQLNNQIVTKVLKNKDASYVNRKEVGSYLKRKVFEPGAVYEWNAMIERATGEKLSAKYFVEQFVQQSGL
jgi:peptidyl-dipeptidase A